MKNDNWEREEKKWSSSIGFSCGSRANVVAIEPMKVGKQINERENSLDKHQKD